MTHLPIMLDLANAQPANSNRSACVETWPVGDPQSFARLLARVLVRRALIDAEVSPTTIIARIRVSLDDFDVSQTLRR